MKAATAVSLALFLALSAVGQETPLAWNATGNFNYNIEKVAVSPVTSSSWTVKVIFSVSNPAPTADFPASYWDIKNAMPFKPAASLRVLVGWDATELTNTNSRGNLNPVATAASSVGAALPVSLNALTGAQACDSSNCAELGGIPLAGRYVISTTIVPMAFPSGATVTAGVVAMEGRPICPLTGPVLAGCPTTGGVATAANIPVTSAVANFSLTGGTPPERRQIVDIANCKKCHDNQDHGTGVVPRLSLHGGNRNENLKLCVICHNANQTDIPFRTSGAEVSIDMKRMVHSIHAGGFRKTPFQVVGYQGTLYDFSSVRFPGELRTCTKCHVGTSYMPPISTKALGSTIQTGSLQATATTLRTVDVDPNNDRKITPTAATCTGCHDDPEKAVHMVRRGGASFSTLQQNIVPGVTEKCVNCHGAGKSYDVKKKHGL